MMTLYKVLDAFNGRNATSEEQLRNMFEEIAKVALYGGYFCINKTVKIYPRDIEFYFYDERSDKYAWARDYNMYHRGKEKDVPYFPLLSLNPHNSGVDVTFENEKEQYRASFLIRAYRYVDDEYDEVFDQPLYLRENMFAYCSCQNGLFIEWVDDPESGERVLDKATRVNFHDKDGNLDMKLWRFIRK
jgi:hypothetical protein